MSDNTPFRDGVRAVQGLTAGADGYALILKSLEVRPGDPSIEFAAALIAERERGSAGHPPKYRTARAKSARGRETRRAARPESQSHLLGLAGQGGRAGRAGGRAGRAGPGSDQEVRMVRRSVGALAAIVAVSMLTVARPALAGRVTWLIYLFDIGSAPSLPWSPDYRSRESRPDTEALLTPSTPVIVRFETLRRAVLYASSDRRVAETIAAQIHRARTRIRRDSARWSGVSGCRVYHQCAVANQRALQPAVHSVVAERQRPRPQRRRLCARSRGLPWHPTIPSMNSARR